MKKIKYQVTNPMGIHSRPAGLLVKEFSRFKCNIIVEKGERAVNGKEIFQLMSLSLNQGDTITITFEGLEETLAAAAIDKFFKEYLLRVR